MQSYDFQKIRKEFKKLKCPKGIWAPLHVPFETCAHNVIMSNRSRGKTTNVLLFGLLMRKYFDVTSAYIRSSDSEIQPKNLRKLFQTIEEYGYIEKIFPEQYNSIKYFGGKYYLTLRDESGEIIAKDDKPFMHLLSIQSAEEYKSTFTDAHCDFIIFDEFIRKIYRPDEFVDFMDLVETIRRNRETTRVIWLANTIDVFSPYFRELVIQSQIETMVEGQSQIVKVKEGASVYVELLGAQTDDKTKELNKFFFGFPNRKLQSIVGGGWSMPVYPHCFRDEEKRTLARNIYVNYNENIINLRLCYTVKNGFFVDCTPANRTYDDSYIYKNGSITQVNEHYYTGEGNAIDKRIWDLYRNNRFFYSDNTTGAIIEAFYKESKYY